MSELARRILVCCYYALEWITITVKFAHMLMKLNLTVMIVIIWTKPDQSAILVLMKTQKITKW